MIKPSFFVDEGLVTLDPLARLLFIGLWTLADREGRLEDRPQRIKMQVLPCDTVDIEPLLQDLVNIGVIERYEIGSKRLINIVNFTVHQHPHHREPASVLPGPALGQPEASPRPALGEGAMDEAEALGQPEASPRPALGQPWASPSEYGIRNTEYGIRAEPRASENEGSVTIPPCLSTTDAKMLWKADDGSEHESPARVFWHEVEQQQQGIGDTKTQARLASMISDTCPKTCSGDKAAVSECLDVLLRAAVKTHGRPSPLFRRIVDEDRRHIR